MFFSYYLLLFKIIEVFYILAVSILPITKESFPFSCSAIPYFVRGRQFL